MAYITSDKADRADRKEMAIDTGVAERQDRIAERAAELIAAAFEDSIAEESSPPDRRTRIVARFAAGLTHLEGETMDGVETQPIPKT